MLCAIPFAYKILPPAGLATSTAPTARMFPLRRFLSSSSSIHAAATTIVLLSRRISDYFQTYQFENLFSKRNSPVAKAVGFWDYHSFITAAAVYELLGFGTTGNKTSQMMEIAAFLGHVGCKTSCGFGVATGGPLAWGLCYNHQMSPSQSYCDDWRDLFTIGLKHSYHDLEELGI